MIILDLETDGLLDELTKIHCAVAYNIETKCFDVFSPDGPNRPEDLPSYLDTVSDLSCHNGHGFDLKVLKKLYNYEYKGNYFDTLLMSRMLWPDISHAEYINEKGKKVKVKAPHSVESWGFRFGIQKPEHEDWSQFSKEMLHRCKEDTKIQAKLYERIINYLNKMKERDPRLDYTDAIKVEHRVWEIIERQCDYGWKFDLPKAFKYQVKLEEALEKIDNKIVPMLPIIVDRKTEKPTKAFKKDGEVTAIAYRWKEENGLEGDIVGDFCKVEFNKTKLSSPEQVKSYMLSCGWEPWEYNFKKDQFNKPLRDDKGKVIKTSPKLPSSEEEWDYIVKLTKNPSLKLIAKRNKISHRLNVIKGWIENTTPEGRVHGQVISCGTNTFRMRHRIIVNVPKVSEKKFFGKQMRSLFTVPEGKVLVGCDANALEARIEGHYVYKLSKEAAARLVDGKIHDVNAEAWGVIRDQAKTGKYLLTFGGGAAKLAAALERHISESKKLYEIYWEANPELTKLKEVSEKSFKKRNYVMSIDKRILPIRYKHALISSLFQSGGAIAMKVALVICDDRLREEGLDYHFVGNFHDEFQVETIPEHAKRVGEIMEESIREAGRVLKLNVPLDAEYKIGKNWAETH